MPEAAARAGEAGAFLSRVQIGAILYVAIIGALVPALQPMLLGALVADGRLNLAQLGQSATFELLGMAVSNTLAGVWLKPVRIRGIGAAAGVALLGANLLTMQLSGGAVLWVRAGAGLASGIYLWFLLCMLARSAAPARWTGVYLVLQSISAVALSAVIGSWILPAFGASGGFACLAGVSVTMIAASALLPPHFTRLDDGGPAGRIPRRGLLALLAVGGVMAATLAIWIYLAPLSSQLGHPEGTAATAISIALAMQMFGGGAAILLGDRVPALIGVCMPALVCILLALAFYSHPGPSLFTIAMAAYGAAWMFGVSYQVPLVIAADPSRRSAMAAGGAQLFGYAAGPLLASLAVHDGDVSGPMLLGQGLFAAAIVLAMMATRDRGPGRRVLDA